MKPSRLICFYFFLTIASYPLTTLSMEARIESGYDSDSEDESEYKYPGYDHLLIPEGHTQQCLVFYRGIHFSPSMFNKQQRSSMRRKCGAGEPIYSSATYDLAHCQFAEEQKSTEILEKIAQGIKKKIIDLKERDLFQQLYTNRYDEFHHRLQDKFKFESQKNPQVSSSETFRHAGKYSFGCKFLGSGTEKLDPEYDYDGKPKHPYLGKIYMFF